MPSPVLLLSVLVTMRGAAAAVMQEEGASFGSMPPPVTATAPLRRVSSRGRLLQGALDADICGVETPDILTDDVGTLHDDQDEASTGQHVDCTTVRHAHTIIHHSRVREQLGRPCVYPSREQAVRPDAITSRGPRPGRSGPPLSHVTVGPIRCCRGSVTRRTAEETATGTISAARRQLSRLRAAPSS